MPALVNAPYENHSPAQPPILTCSVLISTGGSAAAGLSAQNTSVDASFSNQAFHLVIWLWCTSYWMTNSTSVLSTKDYSQCHYRLEDSQVVAVVSIIHVRSCFYGAFPPRSDLNFTYPVAQVSRSSSVSHTLPNISL